MSLEAAHPSQRKIQLNDFCFVHENCSLFIGRRNFKISIKRANGEMCSSMRRLVLKSISEQNQRLIDSAACDFHRDKSVGVAETFAKRVTSLRVWDECDNNQDQRVGFENQHNCT